MPSPLRRTVLLFALALLAACGEKPGSPPAESLAAGSPGGEAAVDESGAVHLERLGYALGAADAPVVVVEFSDFGCPYCARFALETLPELKREFIERGQVRWQYVPFVIGMFPNGTGAARAAMCAGEQERFWPMHDLLYERQREWKASTDAAALFTGYARRLRLDADRFAACFAEDRPGERVALHNAVAEQLGIRGTPSFLVNGQAVHGALPLEQFRQILNWAGAAAR